MYEGITMSLKILVADDNKFTRTVYEDMLKKRGHNVTSASNGDECLSKFKAQWLKKSPGSKVFDSVILDYSMPQANGDEVVGEILRMSPKQDVLILSAYDAGKLKEAFARTKDSIEIIQKGFPIEALIEKLESNEGK